MSLCAICQTAIAEGDETRPCSACGAGYHADCWEENRGCAVYGCPEVPQVEKREGLEVPASFWGEDEKSCPKCEARILAAALRCRHCGATFASARPETDREFREREVRTGGSAGTKRAIAWLFVACAVPVTAPVATVAGWFWYGRRRRDVEALPAPYPGLVRLGLAVGAGQSVLIVVVAALFRLVRS